MPPNAEETLARRLVLRAQTISEETAQLLIAAEGLVRPARPGTIRTARELLDARGARPGEGVAASHDGDLAFDDQVPARSRLRLADLVLRAWDREASTEAEHRPDVLAITCDFLANPREPSTHLIVQFCVTLALRALYGARYTRDSLTRLRQSFERVRNAAATNFGTWRFRPTDSFDDLVIDLLCMNGSLQRCEEAKSCRAYYVSFDRHLFGIDRQTRRRVLGETAECTLRGRPLDYGNLLNLAFNQPSGIPGFDEVTGGLVAPVLDEHSSFAGGLVSLVAGPPGSGKTSLSLAMASRMAELGSHVRYITIEEQPATLESKLDVVASRLAETLSLTLGEMPAEQRFEGEVRPRLFVMDGKAFLNLSDIVGQLEKEFSALRRAELQSARSTRFGLFLVFPRVVVIDSVTALRELPQSTPASRAARPSALSVRRELNDALNSLRELGVCVLLIGGRDDAYDESLAYLVDNVFSLDLDSKISYSHPVRTFTVEKTRLQASGRGRHVLHLGGASGCSISPSLHSVLTQLNRRRLSSPSLDFGAVFSDSTHGQIAPPGIEADSGLVLRARSQVLVFGYGSAGKAKLALTLAIQPRIPLNASSEEQHQLARSLLERSRVLVVSFLYEEAYYRDLSNQLLRRRFGLSEGGEHVDVIAFYPGMLAPETAVAAITARMRTAELWGRPYGAVVIDGVHNIMMQFPLLDHEPLLWPTLYRLLRTKAVETITTFTFFKMAGGAELFPVEGTRQPSSTSSDGLTASPGGRLAVSQELYFHLLLSSCDYTFRIDQPQTSSASPSGGKVRVQLVQGVDAGATGSAFEWDPTAFSMRLIPAPIAARSRS